MATTKVQATNIARQFSTKASSFRQVCKQISGFQGKIAISKKESVSVNKAFKMLGVDIAKTTVTTQDLQKAWAPELLGVAQNEKWRTPLIVKVFPYVVWVNDTAYNLHQLKDGQYKPHKVQKLCEIVGAEQRDKEVPEQVVVSAAVIMKGLVQSLFVTDTLKALKDNIADCNKLESGFVNMGTKDTPNWVEIVKYNGQWIEASKKPEPKPEKPARAPRKNTPKGKKQQKAA